MRKDFFTDDEKEKRRKFALKEHARMAKLFKEKPLMFAIQRRQMLEACIENADKGVQHNMKILQNEIDVMLKGARTSENRLALMQSMLTHHVVNKFLPALEGLATIRLK